MLEIPKHNWRRDLVEWAQNSLRSLAPQKLEPKPEEYQPYREVYNEDQTRKFVFHNRGQVLDIYLYFKGLDMGWYRLMTASTTEYKGKSIYKITVDAIKDSPSNDFPIITYEFESVTGGLKEAEGYDSGNTSINDREFIDDALKNGLLKESELPEYIDFAATLKTFLNQANELNFSNPKLFPKPLVGNNDQKVLE